MDKSVRESWDKIESAFKERAPRYFKDLKGPATAAAISKLEKAIELSLPAPLKTSLMIHNGNRSDVFFDTAKLLRAPEIAKAWKMRTQVAADLVRVGEHTSKSIRTWWHDKLIPITEAEGDAFCVDTSQKGQVLYHRHTEILRSTNMTFTQWLAALAARLERKEFRLEDETLWLDKRPE